MNVMSLKSFYDRDNGNLTCFLVTKISFPYSFHWIIMPGKEMIETLRKLHENFYRNFEIRFLGKQRKDIGIARN